jgi:hypothetical protein
MPYIVSKDATPCLRAAQREGTGASWRAIG